MGRELRSNYNLDGLLPASLSSLNVEIARAEHWIDRLDSPLEKYQALVTLKEASWETFFGVLSRDLAKYAPIIYTPTVGLACQEWSHLLQRPLGLYISIKDAGNVSRVLGNWPGAEAKIAVITDGERILGLGDLGANGLGICTGKAMMHTAAGGVHPRLLLPIVLDVGCNSKAIREDPFYLGLRQERVRGSAYDSFLAEVTAALTARFGEGLLVHWEDFSSRNSYRLLSKARAQGLNTFNDDIESTAAAVLAAILGATQLKGVPSLGDQRFMLIGAGQANIGAARLISRALTEEGLSQAEAKSHIWLFDSKGLVHEGREGLTPEKQEFQRPKAEAGSAQSLAIAVANIRSTALVGATSQKGIFGRDVVEAISKVVEEDFGAGARPIVLALSNPDSRAECTAEEAYSWSKGAAVFASGTTFPPLNVSGRTINPSQANNSLIFPGVGLGSVVGGVIIDDDVMIAAARAVAQKLKKEELDNDSILPSTDRLREVSIGVAAALLSTAAARKKKSAHSPVAGSICRQDDIDIGDSDALGALEACIAQFCYDPMTARAGA